MNKLVLSSTFLFFAISLSLYAQIPDKFIGSWICFCSEAQDGYQNCTLEIKKESVIVTYDDDSYPYTCKWTVLGSDTLRFSWNPLLEVVVNMHFDDSSNPIGVAWWDEGVMLEVPLIITRSNMKE